MTVNIINKTPTSWRLTLKAMRGREPRVFEITQCPESTLYGRFFIMLGSFILNIFTLTGSFIIGLTPDGLAFGRKSEAVRVGSEGL